MTVPSPTPRRITAPRWLDARLVLGVGLVVGAVLAGALVVSRADSTHPMWAATRDLAAGTVVRADDVALVAVRLPDGAGAYLSASEALVGSTVTRQLSAGELVPRGALGETRAATRVTIPLDAQNSPVLKRGERVEFWISTKKCPQVPLLADVAVQDVSDGGGGAFSSRSGQTVVVRVPADLASRVITALALDAVVIRAGQLDGPGVPNANDGLPSLAECGAG